MTTIDRRTILHIAPPARMDSDAAVFMKMLPDPPIVQPTVEMVKEEYRRWRLQSQPDLPQVYEAREYQATGPLGPIPLRVYRGANTPPFGALAALVFYHGGGWMNGDLDSHDWICRMIANKAEYVVVSVDYRLAPEFRFPANFEDALAAMKWIVANAEMLRIDPAHISVGGDGAGGNLAAAVALMTRNEGQTTIESQILLYPAVDLTMGYELYGRYERDVVFTDDDLRASIDCYIPDVEQRRDWRASPMLAPNLQGLPPTLVLVAGFDPLCAAAERYVELLKKAGVTTTLKRYKGQMHGFISNAKLLPKAYDAINDVAKVLKMNKLPARAG